MWQYYDDVARTKADIDIVFPIYPQKWTIPATVPSELPTEYFHDAKPRPDAASECK